MSGAERWALDEACFVCRGLSLYLSSFFSFFFGFDAVVFLGDDDGDF